MIEGVDSENARMGQTYAASIDEPVVVNGQTVFTRGTDVIVKLVDSKESGERTGRAELTLDLQSTHGRPPGRREHGDGFARQRFARRDDRDSRRRHRGMGEIVGAIAGGGKGAAVGAAAGGAAGAGTQVVTKGQRVRIPSETPLTFVLEHTSPDMMGIALQADSHRDRREPRNRPRRRN